MPSKTLLILYTFVLWLSACKKEVARRTAQSPSPPPAVVYPQFEFAPVDSTHIWKWEYIGTPMGDSEIFTMTIHPEDDSLWFVTSLNGIYITRDGGHSWEKHLSGFSAALEIDKNEPSRMFASADSSIYMSADYGKTWSLKYTFPKFVQSILVSKVDNSIYVGISWEDSPTPNGIFKSSDEGNSWHYYSYNVTAKGLIPWDIEEDTVNKKIYVATEIYDHPQPYHPPFLRSSDGGVTWQDVSGNFLTWHADKIQVQPQTNYVYILIEGAAIMYSRNFGDTWEYLHAPFWLDFIIDKNYPQRFFGGAYAESSGGGVYQSYDDGGIFRNIGLVGHIVSGLCMNKTSTALYAACYKSGIFCAR